MSAHLDPRVALATALAAQPGVYALLLGSGVSTGAGIPTGWGVVDSLVRRAAAAAGDKPGDDFDADSWWATNGDGAHLGYSTLLERLGSTKAARRALLAGFFEPTDEERDAELKVPGPAHRAIAALVRKGVVRVIITTNFDRLLESALQAEGISAQIVTSDKAIAGMEPMQHMPCTIIKLHGDYVSLDQRNTVDELSSYPKRTNALLSRVLDEYGLIVSGWSGDWDPALVSALTANPNRRYPLFWSARSGLGDVARALTSRTGAQVVDGLTADEFFPDVLSRVEAIESMADTPQSVSLNIARVKRALPDPRRRIELRDLFDNQLGAIRTHLASRPPTAPSSEWEDVEEAHRDMVARTETLLRMFATGIYLDGGEEHSDLWVHVVQSALRARVRPTGSFTPWWDNLQHLPALLLLTAGTAAAVAAKHETLAIRLQTEPTWTDPHKGNDARPAFDVIHTYKVLEPDVINGFPSSGTTKWLYPQSHFLKGAVLPVVQSISGDESEALVLFNNAEYRAALSCQFFAEDGRYFHWSAPGEFLLDRSNSGTAAKFWAADLRQTGAEAVWRTRTGLEAAEFDRQLDQLTEILETRTSWS